MLIAILPPGGGAAYATVRKAIAGNRAVFDDERTCLFGILGDPALIAEARSEIPGVRWVVDVDGAVSAALWALAGDGTGRPGWLLLDPALRVIASAPLEAGAEVAGVLERLPPALIATCEARSGEPLGLTRAAAGQTVLIGDESPRWRSRTGGANG